MGSDSLTVFLKSVQPDNPFYRVFLDKLKRQGLTRGERAKILVNLEKSRWRQEDNIWNHQKYVVVNIPAYQLMAVDGQDTLTMRIGCGSLKTKTPLLNSRIKRMDVNPNGMCHEASSCTIWRIMPEIRVTSWQETTM